MIAEVGEAEVGDSVGGWVQELLARGRRRDRCHGVIGRAPMLRWELGFFAERRESE